MRSYAELVSDEPAWPALEAAARESGRVTILPREPAAARSCLERLQVTTRSTLGALAHETGGLLVDHGWLRVFGCGHDRLRRALGGWNETLGIPLSDFMIVADVVVGGAFAISVFRARDPRTGRILAIKEELKGSGSTYPLAKLHQCRLRRPNTSSRSFREPLAMNAPRCRGD